VKEIDTANRLIRLSGEELSSQEGVLACGDREGQMSLEDFTVRCDIFVKQTPEAGLPEIPEGRALRPSLH
jgi:hypothetical protein